MNSHLKNHRETETPKLNRGKKRVNRPTMSINQIATQQNNTISTIFSVKLDCARQAFSALEHHILIFYNIYIHMKE